MNNATVPLPKPFESLCNSRVVPTGDALADLLVSQALSAASTSAGMSSGVALACAFDLLVAARFHNAIKPENWLWCPECERDFHPVLNACPGCSLSNRFIHFSGNKPGSGIIGPVTSASLQDLLASLFRSRGESHKEVYVCREPADLAILDTAAHAAFFCEVKAAPLFTAPCSVAHATETFAVNATLPLNHRQGTMRRFHQLAVSLLIPTAEGAYYLPISGTSPGERQWAELGLAATLRNDPTIFPKVAKAWSCLWNLYKTKNTADPRIWFTGGCGRPRNPGEGWPTDAAGKPLGAISDGKTSVGMDRTDDIKKSTFQVLKLGVEHRGHLESSSWKIGIGLLGNLPAARHYADYLAGYEEIAWSRTPANDAPRQWANLFDAVASFTESRFRAPFLSGLLIF